MRIFIKLITGFLASFIIGIISLNSGVFHDYMVKMWQEIQFIIVWDLSKEVFVILITVYCINRLSSRKEDKRGEKPRPSTPKPNIPPPPINPKK